MRLVAVKFPEATPDRTTQCPCQRSEQFLVEKCREGRTQSTSSRLDQGLEGCAVALFFSC